MTADPQTPDHGIEFEFVVQFHYHYMFIKTFDQKHFINTLDNSDEAFGNHLT